MGDTVTLCTHQALGHDITLAADPLSIYRPGGHWYDLARKYGWRSFVWSWLERDYKNQRKEAEQFILMANYIDQQNKHSKHKHATLHSRLWVLRVPEEEIRYVGRANDRNVMGEIRYGKRSQFDSADACRRAGQLPECIIQHPVKPEWVVNVSDVIDSIAVGPVEDNGLDPAVFLDKIHKWNRK
jgi:hypothetical protein